MSNFENYFRIGGIVIKIESAFEFHTFNAENFACGSECAVTGTGISDDANRMGAMVKPDYVFRFQKTNNIQTLIEGAQIIDNCRWADVFQRPDGSLVRGFLWKEVFYTEVTELGDREGTCYYADEGIIWDRFRDGFEMLNYLCIEEILLKFGALVLHSSHLNYRGQGLLFSAPSQTGKSTQAELWRQSAGAEVMNGDRTILRKVDGVWHAFGSPMCGTSNIHRDGDEPLYTIVMLSQGKENVCVRLAAGAAFRLLYPQITVPNWDEAKVDQVFDLLNDLIAAVPIWSYSCNMEPSAVTTLRKAIGWDEE